MITPMKTLTHKKDNKTYEVIDERARIEIEKLKLLTGTDAVEKITDYSINKADVIVSTKSGQLISTTDSAKAKPKNIRLYGKTEQPSTEGNQLFGGVIEDITYRDGVFVSSTLKSAIVPIQGGETYTISITTADTIFTSTTSDYPSIGVATVDAYAGSGGVKINKKTLSTNVNANYLVIGFGSGVDAHTDEIMVNKGNTALPLEKFTGGEASPNMNYQQPLNSHGDSGSIVGKVLNANMCNKEKCVLGGNPNINFPFKTGSYLWVETDIKVKNGDVLYIYYSINDVFNAKDTFFMSNSSSSGTIVKVEKNKAIINFDGTLFVRLDLIKYDGTEVVDNLIISRTPITEYEPYTEQLFTVFTPNGLKGIGDVRDYIDLEKGKRIQRFLEVSSDEATAVADMSAYAGVKSNVAGFRIYFTNFGLIKGGHSLCSHLPHWISIWGANVIGHHQLEKDSVDITVPYEVLGITQDASSNDRRLAINEWLENNTMTFLFELENPIITDLTQEELDQYNALVMNYPNTTIINSDNAYMEVEYVADTKKYIDNMQKKHDEDIATLKTAIIALGGTV